MRRVVLFSSVLGGLAAVISTAADPAAPPSVLPQPVAVVPYDGPRDLDLADTAFSTQLHIHGSFSEGSGSMDSQTHEARRVGVDVLWWTDHEAYFTHYHDVTSFHFEDFTELWWEGEDWTPLKYSHVGLTKSFDLESSEGMESFDAVISDLQAWEGQHSLRLRGVNDEAEFAQLYYLFNGSQGRQRIHTIASGVSLELAIFPQTMSADARATVDLELSNHGTDPDLYGLHYFLDDDPQAEPFLEGHVYHVPLNYVENSWNNYVLPITQDAVDGFGSYLGEDNGMRALRIGVESRLGQAAVAFFDDLQITHELGYPELFEKQRTMLDAVEANLPEVEQLQGAEISEEIHMNDYSVGTELPDYDALAESGGFLDEEGMIVDVQAFQEYIARYVADQSHQRDGLAVLCHPYGPTPDDTGGIDPQIRLDRLVSVGVYDVDMLEVGYRSRGGHNLADHLWLWDELAKAQHYLLGIGVSDSHGTDFGSTETEPNNFVTWIYADSAAKPDLIDGMRRSRAYFGDITLFDGLMDLATANGFVMGQVVVTDKVTEEVTVEIEGLEGGEEVRTFWNGTQANTYIASGASFFQTESLAIGDGTSWRVEVYEPDGTEKVFSNPIYLEPEVPAAGLSSYRAGIDVIGVHSTLIDAFTLTGLRYRQTGARARLKLDGIGNGGTVVLDFQAVGQPTTVLFSGGLTGSWSYDVGFLTLWNLEGQGAIRIEKTG